MGTELKCPLGCGITLEQVGPENPLWRHGRTMAPAGHRYCILESRTGTIEEWTARRTPDLTEAVEVSRFKTALSAWREVVDHRAVSAEDDYHGFAEFRTLRAAARGLAAWAYCEAMLPVEDVAVPPEALARLKALEEEMWQPQFVSPQAGAFGIQWTSAPFLSKWAKEIAAIRNKLEGK